MLLFLSCFEASTMKKTGKFFKVDHVCSVSIDSYEYINTLLRVFCNNINNNNTIYFQLKAHTIKCMKYIT